MVGWRRRHRLRGWRPWEAQRDAPSGFRRWARRCHRLLFVLDERWFEYAQKGQIAVALRVVEAITHHEYVVDREP